MSGLCRTGHSSGGMYHSLIHDKHKGLALLVLLRFIMISFHGLPRQCMASILLVLQVIES